MAWGCDLPFAQGRLSETLLPLEKADEQADALRCAARHLVVAASQLAREAGTPHEVATRYSAAEGLFRAQAAALSGLSTRSLVPGPSVQLTATEEISLTFLFAGICEGDQWWRVHRSINPEMVHAAREILLGLKWHLPDEPHDLGARIEPATP